MSEAIKVRFAPAPTGYLHLGSARAALFNWLYAKHLAGLGQDATFVLRIEDTDKERSKPELITSLLDTLRWLGLDWDGEPVLQSDRTDMYMAAIEKLLADGNAYRCDCTQEAAKARADERGRPGYDGFCRDRSVGPESSHVVRFRTPDEGVTGFDDLIRGRVEVANENIEDFVLQRSDGSPVFFVANAVDDADMGITHVIRGEDLINITPKVLLIRSALGVGEVPTFAHMPLIVNEQRKKLSKRRDDVSVGDFKDRGFLPEAMVNYLALLGWGPPDGIEVRPISEIIALFDIADVNSAPAAFDIKKLESINADYIRAMSPERLLAEVRPMIDDMSWASGFDEATFLNLAREIASRVRFVHEIPPLLEFLFSEVVPHDDESWAKATKDPGVAKDLLQKVAAAYREVGDADWNSEHLHQITVEVGESVGLKLGKAQAPIRVAVTGNRVGLPLFESLAQLGKDQTVSRIDSALERL